MKPPVFLDTGAIHALADADDRRQPIVQAIYDDLEQTFILHELILVEAFSLITKRVRKQVALAVVGAFRESARVEKVPLTPDLLAAGWRRCQRYADKEWDWIDCVSFELMGRRACARRWRSTGISRRPASRCSCREARRGCLLAVRGGDGLTCPP